MNNKFKIIETPNYILAVSDEEPKMLEWFYDRLDLISSIPIYKRGNKQKSYKGCVRIIAYQSKGNTPELNGLPLLPEIIVEDDVEKLALNFCKHLLSGTIIKAKSINNLEEYKPKEFELLLGELNLNGKELFKEFNKNKASAKVYSEKDLKKAFCFYSFSSISQQPYNNEELEETFDRFIQSLEQFKIPRWFVAEKIKYADEDLYKVTELKTKTINGKNYLVGTYKYE